MSLCWSFVLSLKIIHFQAQLRNPCLKSNPDLNPNPHPKHDLNPHPKP